MNILKLCGCRWRWFKEGFKGRGGVRLTRGSVSRHTNNRITRITVHYIFLKILKVLFFIKRKHGVILLWRLISICISISNCLHHCSGLFGLFRVHDVHACVCMYVCVRFCWEWCCIADFAAWLISDESGIENDGAFLDNIQYILQKWGETNHQTPTTFTQAGCSTRTVASG